MTKHPFTRLVAINIASIFLFTTIAWAAPPTSQSRGLRGIPNSKFQISNVIPAKAGIQKEIPHQVRDDNNPRTRELANSRTESIFSHYTQSNALRMNQFSDTGADKADKAIRRIAKQKGITGIGPVLALSGVLTLFFAAVVFGGNYSPQIVDSFGNSDLALAVKDSLAQFQSMAADSVSAAADVVQNAGEVTQSGGIAVQQSGDTLTLRVFFDAVSKGSPSFWSSMRNRAFLVTLPFTLYALFSLFIHSIQIYEFFASFIKPAPEKIYDEHMHLTRHAEVYYARRLRSRDSEARTEAYTIITRNSLNAVKILRKVTLKALHSRHSAARIDALEWLLASKGQIDEKYYAGIYEALFNSIIKTSPRKPYYAKALKALNAYSVEPVSEEYIKDKRNVRNVVKVLMSMAYACAIVAAVLTILSLLSALGIDVPYISAAGAGGLAQFANIIPADMSVSGTDVVKGAASAAAIAGSSELLQKEKVPMEKASSEDETTIKIKHYLQLKTKLDELKSRWRKYRYNNIKGKGVCIYKGGILFAYKGFMHNGRYYAFSSDNVVNSLKAKKLYDEYSALYEERTAVEEELGVGVLVPTNIKDNIQAAALKLSELESDTRAYSDIYKILDSLRVDLVRVSNYPVARIIEQITSHDWYSGILSELIKVKAVESKYEGLDGVLNEVDRIKNDIDKIQDDAVKLAVMGKKSFPVVESIREEMASSQAGEKNLIADEDGRVSLGGLTVGVFILTGIAAAGLLSPSFSDILTKGLENLFSGGSFMLALSGLACLFIGKIKFSNGHKLFSALSYFAAVLLIMAAFSGTDIITNILDKAGELFFAGILSGTMDISRGDDQANANSVRSTAGNAVSKKRSSAPDAGAKTAVWVYGKAAQEKLRRAKEAAKVLWEEIDETNHILKTRIVLDNRGFEDAFREFYNAVEKLKKFPEFSGKYYKQALNMKSVPGRSAKEPRIISKDRVRTVEQDLVNVQTVFGMCRNAVEVTGDKDTDIRLNKLFSRETLQTRAEQIKKTLAIENVHPEIDNTDLLEEMAGDVRDYRNKIKRAALWRALIYAGFTAVSFGLIFSYIYLMDYSESGKGIVTAISTVLMMPVMIVPLVRGLYKDRFMDSWRLPVEECDELDLIEHCVIDIARQSGRGDHEQFLDMMYKNIFSYNYVRKADVDATEIFGSSNLRDTMLRYHIRKLDSWDSEVRKNSARGLGRRFKSTQQKEKAVKALKKRLAEEEPGSAVYLQIRKSLDELGAEGPFYEKQVTGKKLIKQSYENKYAFAALLNKIRDIISAWPDENDRVKRFNAVWQKERADVFWKGTETPVSGKMFDNMFFCWYLKQARVQIRSALEFGERGVLKNTLSEIEDVLSFFMRDRIEAQTLTEAVYKPFVVSKKYISNAEIRRLQRRIKSGDIIKRTNAYFNLASGTENGDFYISQGVFRALKGRNKAVRRDAVRWLIENAKGAEFEGKAREALSEALMKENDEGLIIDIKTVLKKLGVEKTERELEEEKAEYRYMNAFIRSLWGLGAATFIFAAVIIKAGGIEMPSFSDISSIIKIVSFAAGLIGGTVSLWNLTGGAGTEVKGAAKTKYRKTGEAAMYISLAAAIIFAAAVFLGPYLHLASGMLILGSGTTVFDDRKKSLNERAADDFIVSVARGISWNTDRVRKDIGSHINILMAAIDQKVQQEVDNERRYLKFYLTDHSVSVEDANALVENFMQTLNGNDGHTGYELRQAAVERMKKRRIEEIKAKSALTEIGEEKINDNIQVLADEIFYSDSDGETLSMTAVKAKELLKSHLTELDIPDMTNASIVYSIIDDIGIIKRNIFNYMFIEKLSECTNSYIDDPYIEDLIEEIRAEGFNGDPAEELKAYMGGLLADAAGLPLLMKTLYCTFEADEFLDDISDKAEEPKEKVSDLLFEEINGLMQAVLEGDDKAADEYESLLGQGVAVLLDTDIEEVQELTGRLKYSMNIPQTVKLNAVGNLRDALIEKAKAEASEKTDITESDKTVIEEIIGKSLADIYDFGVMDADRRSALSGFLRNRFTLLDDEAGRLLLWLQDELKKIDRFIENEKRRSFADMERKVRDGEGYKKEALKDSLDRFTRAVITGNFNAILPAEICLKDALTDITPSEVAAEEFITGFKNTLSSGAIDNNSQKRFYKLDALKTDCWDRIKRNASIPIDEGYFKDFIENWFYEELLESATYDISPKWATFDRLLIDPDLRSEITNDITRAVESAADECRKEFSDEWNRIITVNADKVYYTRDWEYDSQDDSLEPFLKETGVMINEDAEVIVHNGEQDLEVNPKQAFKLIISGKGYLDEDNCVVIYEPADAAVVTGARQLVGTADKDNIFIRVDGAINAFINKTERTTEEAINTEYIRTLANALFYEMLFNKSVSADSAAENLEKFLSQFNISTEDRSDCLNSLKSDFKVLTGLFTERFPDEISVIADSNTELITVKRAEGDDSGVPQLIISAEAVCKLLADGKVYMNGDNEFMLYEKASADKGLTGLINGFIAEAKKHTTGVVDEKAVERWITDIFGVSAQDRDTCDDLTYLSNSLVRELGINGDIVRDMLEALLISLEKVDAEPVQNHVNTGRAAEISPQMQSIIDDFAASVKGSVPSSILRGIAFNKKLFESFVIGISKEPGHRRPVCSTYKELETYLLDTYSIPSDKVFDKLNMLLNRLAAIDAQKAEKPAVSEETLVAKPDQEMDEGTEPDTSLQQFPQEVSAELQRIIDNFVESVRIKAPYAAVKYMGIDKGLYEFSIVMIYKESREKRREGIFYKDLKKYLRETMSIETAGDMMNGLLNSLDGIDAGKVEQPSLNIIEEMLKTLTDDFCSRVKNCTNDELLKENPLNKELFKNWITGIYKTPADDRARTLDYADLMRCMRTTYNIRGDLIGDVLDMLLNRLDAVDAQKLKESASEVQSMDAPEFEEYQDLAVKIRRIEFDDAKGPKVFGVYTDADGNERDAFIVVVNNKITKDILRALPGKTVSVLYDKTSRTKKGKLWINCHLSSVQIIDADNLSTVQNADNSAKDSGSDMAESGVKELRGVNKIRTEFIEATCLHTSISKGIDAGRLGMYINQMYREVQDSGQADHVTKLELHKYLSEDLGIEFNDAASAIKVLEGYLISLNDTINTATDNLFLNIGNRLRWKFEEQEIRDYFGSEVTFLTMVIMDNDADGIKKRKYMLKEALEKEGVHSRQAKEIVEEFERALLSSNTRETEASAGRLSGALERVKGDFLRQLRGKARLMRLGDEEVVNNRVENLYKNLPDAEEELGNTIRNLGVTNSIVKRDLMEDLKASLKALQGGSENPTEIERIQENFIEEFKDKIYEPAEQETAKINEKIINLYQKVSYETDKAVLRSARHNFSNFLSDIGVADRQTREDLITALLIDMGVINNADKTVKAQKESKRDSITPEVLEEFERISAAGDEALSEVREKLKEISYDMVNIGENFEVSIVRELKDSGYLAFYQGIRIFIPRSLAGEGPLHKGDKVEVVVQEKKDDKYGKQLICAKKGVEPHQKKEKVQQKRRRAPGEKGGAFGGNGRVTSSHTVGTWANWKVGKFPTFKGNSVWVSIFAAGSALSLALKYFFPAADTGAVQQVITCSFGGNLAGIALIAFAVLTMSNKAYFAEDRNPIRRIERALDDIESVKGYLDYFEAKFKDGEDAYALTPEDEEVSAAIRELGIRLSAFNKTLSPHLFGVYFNTFAVLRSGLHYGSEKIIKRDALAHIRNDMLAIRSLFVRSAEEQGIVVRTEVHVHGAMNGVFGSVYKNIEDIYAFALGDSASEIRGRGIAVFNADAVKKAYLSAFDLKVRLFFIDDPEKDDILQEAEHIAAGWVEFLRDMYIYGDYEVTAEKLAEFEKQAAEVAGVCKGEYNYADSPFADYMDLVNNERFHMIEHVIANNDERIRGFLSLYNSAGIITDMRVEILAETIQSDIEVIEQLNFDGRENTLERLRVALEQINNIKERLIKKSADKSEVETMLKSVIINGSICKAFRQNKLKYGEEFENVIKDQLIYTLDRETDDTIYLINNEMTDIDEALIPVTQLFEYLGRLKGDSVDVDYAAGEQMLKNAVKGLGRAISMLSELSFYEQSSFMKQLSGLRNFLFNEQDGTYKMEQYSRGDINMYRAMLDRFPVELKKVRGENRIKLAMAVRPSDKIFVTLERHRKLRSWLAKKWKTSEIKIDIALSDEVKKYFEFTGCARNFHNPFYNRIESDTIDKLYERGCRSSFVKKPVKRIRMVVVRNMVYKHGHADHASIRRGICYVDGRIYDLLLEKYGKPEADKLWLDFCLHVYGELLTTYRIFLKRDDISSLNEFVDYLDNSENRAEVEKIIARIHREAPPVPKKVQKIIDSMDKSEDVLKEQQGVKLERVIRQEKYNILGNNTGLIVQEGNNLQQGRFSAPVKFINKIADARSNNIGKGDIVVFNIDPVNMGVVSSRASVVVLAKGAVKYGEGKGSKTVEEITSTLNPGACVIVLSTLDIPEKIANIADGAMAEYTFEKGSSSIIMNLSGIRDNIVEDIRNEIAQIENRLMGLLSNPSTDGAGYKVVAARQWKNGFEESLNKVELLLGKLGAFGEFKNRAFDLIREFDGLMALLNDDKPVTLYKENIAGAFNSLEKMRILVQYISSRHNIVRPAAKEDAQTLVAGGQEARADEIIEGIERLNALTEPSEIKTGIERVIELINTLPGERSPVMRNFSDKLESARSACAEIIQLGYSADTKGVSSVIKEKTADLNEMLLPDIAAEKGSIRTVIIKQLKTDFDSSGDGAEKIVSLKVQLSAAVGKMGQCNFTAEGGKVFESLDIAVNGLRSFIKEISANEAAGESVYKEAYLHMGKLSSQMLLLVYAAKSDKLKQARETALDMVRWTVEIEKSLKEGDRVFAYELLNRMAVNLDLIVTTTGEWIKERIEASKTVAEDEYKLDVSEDEVEIITADEHVTIYKADSKEFYNAVIKRDIKTMNAIVTDDLRALKENEGTRGYVGAFMALPENVSVEVSSDMVRKFGGFTQELINEYYEKSLITQDDCNFNFIIRAKDEDDKLKLMMDFGIDQRHIFLATEKIEGAVIRLETSLQGNDSFEALLHKSKPYIEGNTVHMPVFLKAGDALNWYMMLDNIINSLTDTTDFAVDNIFEALPEDGIYAGFTPTEVLRQRNIAIQILGNKI